MYERETVLFIPALAATAELFRPQIEALADRWDVIVGEHREDDSFPAMAQRILASAPPRFALVGLSMGGYAAFEVLRQEPGRVSKLALVDTSAKADDAEAKDRRRQAIAAAETGGYETLFEGMWERLVHADRCNDAVLKTLVFKMMRETGAEAFIRQQRAIMARPDSFVYLPHIVVPTLVIVGDGDQITPVDGARAMAEQIPAARLAIVPDCGHLSSLERPEKVAAELRCWLEAADDNR